MGERLKAQLKVRGVDVWQSPLHFALCREVVAETAILNSKSQVGVKNPAIEAQINEEKRCRGPFFLMKSWHFCEKTAIIMNLTDRSQFFDVHFFG